MSRRALVTGAGGFIGSHVSRALLERGFEVRALLRPGEATRNLDGLGLELAVGDVRDPGAVRAAVKGCEAVFHLASIYAVWTREPGLIEAVNVGGTRTLFEAALAEGVGRVVVTTSQGVWAGLPFGTLIDESVEPNPGGVLQRLGDAYCLSKLAVHGLVEEYAARGLDVVAAAPATPFGPGDLGPTPTGQILTSIVNLPVFTYVESIVNPIDVRDVALGHVLAFERGRKGRTYLLGGAENLTLSELVREVLAQTGLRRPAFRVPFPLALATAHWLEAWANLVSKRPPLIAPGALKVARCGFRLDCRRAREELGLVTRPHQECIRDALEWFGENGYLRTGGMRKALPGPISPEQV